MSFMQRLIYKYRCFMMGRYGMDQFNLALLVIGMILSVILSFTVGFPWFYLSYVPYFYMLFRVFSKNLAARRKENEAFLRVWYPFAGWLRVKKSAFRDRKFYKYFRCPNCGLNLRAPRGKGRIKITCQKCRHNFIKKT